MINFCPRRAFSTSAKKIPHSSPSERLSARLLSLEIFALFLGFFPSVQKMLYSHYWVMPKHSWPRISHHFLCFFSHSGFVTVNRTFSTSGLFLLEWASVQALECVFQKLCAFFTKPVIYNMMPFAVKLCHGINRSLLSPDPRMLFLARLFVVHLHPSREQHIENSPTKKLACTKPL